MFDTICTLPLSDDLFAQALHPRVPLVVVGLASGHVATLTLPPLSGPDVGSDDDAPASVNGFGQIETQWRTRRHKGSCRSLAFSLEGDVLFSSGTDGIVKVADTETGKVVDKLAIALDPSTDNIDAPSLIHVLSPQTFLLATDSSALYLYDLRVSSASKSSKPYPSFAVRKPQQTHHPHSDYISSLTPLPPSETSTSGYSKQWVSTGGTTLAVTDLRRGVLVQSEDQEEILLSSVFVSGLSTKRGGTSKGEKVVVGGGAGVLTLWEKGVWDDQDERIVVDRGYEPGGGESIDSLALVPESVGGSGRVLAAGMGDGKVNFVRLGVNKVVDMVRHDDMEGVVELGFDVGGRMISGGGSVIKVWHEKVDEDNGRYVDGDEKRSAGSDSDEEDEEDGNEDSSDDDNSGRKRRKRRKRNRGREQAGAQNPLSFSGLD